MSLTKLMDLTGRVAIVTGGSRGLGLQIAEALGEMGAKLAITARKADELDQARAHLTALGIDVITVASDMGKPETPQMIVAAVMARHGAIDILVNNAGATWGAAAEDHSLEAWTKLVNVNLTGNFLLCQAVAKASMIPKKRGRIVNIASVAGKEGNPGAPAYSATKAGVIALTKSLGKELAKYDIGVNAVTPAVAKTTMALSQEPEFLKMILAKIPRGRMLELAEAASMICFLATAENSFTTGSVFDLSGGRATY